MCQNSYYRKLHKSLKKKDDDYYHERLPNRSLAEGIDNSMAMGAEIELHEFIPTNKFGPARALGEDEERIVVEGVHPLTNEVFMRSKIRNKVDDTSYFEVAFKVVDGQRVHPTLHFSCDLGSVGYPAILWLLGKAKVRGTMVALLDFLT